jgi:hypothetical protein
MRVDPWTQLNEAITSVLEAIAYPSLVVLAVALLVVVALELRSRTTRSTGDHSAARRGDSHGRNGRLAGATR